MKKFGIEIKWGIIFTLVMLVWMTLEKLLGFHGKHIDKHFIVTNFFFIPAVLVFIFALLDKRKNFYEGKMTWLEGFLSGFAISIVVTIFSPLTQFLTSVVISPEYFPNIIAHTVETGKMTQEQAEAYFNLQSYLFQSALGSLLMGAVTSAVIALFVRKK